MKRAMQIQWKKRISWRSKFLYLFWWGWLRRFRASFLQHFPTSFKVIFKFPHLSVSLTCLTPLVKNGLGWGSSRRDMECLKMEDVPLNVIKEPFIVQLCGAFSAQYLLWSMSNYTWFLYGTPLHWTIRSRVSCIWWLLWNECLVLGEKICAALCHASVNWE